MNRPTQCWVSEKEINVALFLKMQVLHLGFVPLPRARSPSPFPSHARAHAPLGRVQRDLGSGFRAHVREEGKDG